MFIPGPAGALFGTLLWFLGFSGDFLVFLVFLGSDQDSFLGSDQDSRLIFHKEDVKRRVVLCLKPAYLWVESGF